MLRRSICSVRRATRSDNFSVTNFVICQRCGSRFSSDCKFLHLDWPLDNGENDKKHYQSPIALKSTLLFANEVTLMSTALFSWPAAIIFLAISCLPLAMGQTKLGVYTQQYNNGRTGSNSVEKFLTPKNVNSTQFGKLF